MPRPTTAAVRLLTSAREPVRLCATTNIDVDTGGLQTIDGVLTEVGDRILLTGQTDGSENGIRTASTGQWYRASDARTARTIQKGTTAYVQEGTANAGKTFTFNTLDPVVGDTNLDITADETPIAADVLTTRGDLLFRNATEPARLAASTAGYLLQTNGAGADPSWAGFLQAGTSAVTRTWQDKARERISVKDFGAVGNGVTDDTAAIQAAETYRATVGGELVFPPGTYQISAASITVNRANGGAWRGIGEAMLRASANTTFLCILTGAVAGTTNKPFLITGIHFHGGGFTACRGVHETTPYGTTIENCTFTQMAFARPSSAVLFWQRRPDGSRSATSASMAVDHGPSTASTTRSTYSTSR
ncbi:head decoration protein [Mesorhizobium sp. LNJC405B00]|uniref:head decoration protein n=1 Tax=unclassified Mesorhizobium TaxID=325217 RepID=UPI0003CE2192|nr:head decoration protein [Mesorhizobium sp. LNJC405B00]ESX95875.1 head decoration protein [Mesorhizobium sp. LNJC405B00]